MRLRGQSSNWCGVKAVCRSSAVGPIGSNVATYSVALRTKERSRAQELGKNSGHQLIHALYFQMLISVPGDLVTALLGTLLRMLNLLLYPCDVKNVPRLSLID